MTSRRLPPGVVGVIVGYTISLWSFIPAWPADTSQAIVGSDERPTFVTWPEKGLGLSIDLTGFRKEIDHGGKENQTVAAILWPPFPRRNSTCLSPLRKSRRRLLQKDAWNSSD